MSTARHRVPRARHDPVATAHDALAVAALAASSLPRHETIAFLLDDAFRGTGLITVVTDTDDGDSVVQIGEVMGEVGSLSHGVGVEAAYLVIATIRPNGSVEPDDARRWCAASDVVDGHGLTLLEWFVIGRDGPECPRDLLGEPDRWPR